MRKIAALAVLAGAALALAACGSAEDASTEASADTVEMPADAALAPIDEQPVADPSATATDVPDAEATAAPADEAGEAAAEVAAEAAAAAEAGTE